LPVGQGHHAGDSTRLLTGLERCGQLGSGGLAFAHHHGIHRRTGEDEVPRQKGGVVSSYEDVATGQELLGAFGRDQGTVDVGAEAAAYAYRLGAEAAESLEERAGRIYPQVHHLYLVSLPLQSGPYALEPQRLYQKHPAEAEAGSLERLDE